MRPGTGMRPSTGQRNSLGSRQGIGTARGGPVNMSGVGMNTSMNISERPVTQQGLSGIRTAGMGPSRQIQDNSYYLQLLRAKNAEIIAEIEVLKGQIDQGKRDNQAYGQLERKYETLTNEMRSLQGASLPPSSCNTCFDCDPRLVLPASLAASSIHFSASLTSPSLLLPGQLADYNLLLDRTRVHREVDDVTSEAHALQNSNASDRHRARDVEHQLARHHQAMAARLEEVDPAMKEHFIKLQTKHQILTTQELPKRQADANFFDEKVREMEMAVTRDPMRAKASSLIPQLELTLIPQLELTLIPQLSVSHNLLSQLDDSAASLRIVGALVVASFSFRSLNGTCEHTHTNETDETARTRWSHGVETCVAARRLRDELIRLERKHQMLTEELDGPQLTESQQREMLLQKVKADNSDIMEAERAVTENQEAIRRGRSQLSQLSNEMNEANDPKTQKYQELFAKDKEMSELIDTFDEKKAAELKKIEVTSEKIVNLLQAISRKTAQSENAVGMSEDKFNEMRSDLDFKQMQMDNSISTSARLEGEHQRRKVRALERWREVFDGGGDLATLKESSEQRSEDLKEAKKTSESLVGTVKERHLELKKEYEAIRAKLTSDEVATSIDEMEQKMRHHEQTIYMLMEYIDTKVKAFHNHTVTNCRA
ncbi:MAG: hypothetical protein SGPRY_008324 [Prymnesium sp.]